LINPATATQGQSKTITNSQLYLPLQIPAADLISRRNSPPSAVNLMNSLLS
jgi:hypothetical protein